ncbi:stage II sporulation protein P [Bacillus canaveralius]|uniref:Stage II sporulation protein P n=1 Tax=Bacillus canaveralius TaxID=1403243 RepID=A0A2N5GR10_9BACI|nr:stage II sporulation protein P [Bacillus canaveralius]PLR85882.1 stage II sporulation protein P [Bacillus canaveralius]PLS00001.1 stage II sporulation protein P [Bacillus canaveralius]
MKHYKQSGIMVAVQGTTIVKAVLAILLFLLMSFSISGTLTALKPEYRITSASVYNTAANVTGEMLYQLIGFENHHFMKAIPDSGSPALSSFIFKLSTNINLDDPRSFLGRELPGFSIFDGKILVAGEGTNYTNMPIESAPPIEVLKDKQEAALQNTEDIEPSADDGKHETPPITTGSKQVYVYFSHNRESFLPYLEGVTDPDLAQHSEINVTKIGDKLKEELESKGIGTMVDKTDIQQLLNQKGLRYPKSYQESRAVVEAAVTANRDLNYLIDIHRDSRRREHTTKEINGQSYAKLAFVIGERNPNYEKNLKLANELHNLLDQKYGPGLSRGIIAHKDEGNNSLYNQDLSENAMLIEFGGVDNTFDELNRSAAALADVFSEYYWQAEQVNKPLEEKKQEN